jgi:hypothetical protein
VISRYLEKKESVWVLFANLDKGWSTQGIDVTDAISLRCLIDAGRKVERDMQWADHKFRCIVFVRNDVYEHLMTTSADYGIGQTQTSFRKCFAFVLSPVWTGMQPT